MLLAQYDSVGPSIFTAFLLAAIGVIASYVFTYASHIFLSITEGTAAGQDDVDWPDLPLPDWLGRGFAMAWIVLVTMSPMFVLGRLLSADRTSASLLFAVMGFGVLFPWVMLSVQSSNSVFIVLHPKAIGRIFTRTEAVVGYYLAVVPVMAVSAFAIHGLHALNPLLAPMFALIVAWAVISVARLYGRFALKMSRNKRRRPGQRSPVSRVGPKPIVQRDLPEAPAEFDESYGMRATNAPIEPVPDPPTLKRVWIEDDDDGQPMEMLGDAVKPLIPDAILNPSEQEMRLIGARRGQPPKRIWADGTYSFAFRGHVIWPLFLITTGITIISWLWRPIHAALLAGNG